MVRQDVEVFRLEVYDENRKDFFEKFEAYASPVIGDQLHRGHIYRVRMNEVARYPRIEAILHEDLVQPGYKTPACRAGDRGYRG